MKKLTIPFLILVLSLKCLAQPYPSPALPDTSKSGKYIARTMNLLASSTPEKRNTVKILVYGQSISEQDWWLGVKSDLIKRFPNANLIMENRAIAGFSSQILYKTVVNDVCSFYPDLVIFHVYGDNRYYDTIMYQIRSRTTAEVAIQTDHYTGANTWSDDMCYNYIPSYAAKYGCEMLDIRRSWIKYLSDNTLEPKALLRDDVHLNDYGNFLMAELTKSYLYEKNRYKIDTFGLLTTYIVGKDVNFVNDTLTLPFSGNRVDLVTATKGFTKADSARILLDGYKPSEFQGNYFVGRPYNDKGDCWPWCFGAMVRTSNRTPLIEENWQCRITRINETMDDFDFEITGSKTGFDGKGNSKKRFTSNSGRVIINQFDAESDGDWHIQRTFNVSKVATNVGDVIRWKSYKLCNDTYIPQIKTDTTIENTTTLFQGVANANHTLKIAKAGVNQPPITAIKVYRPYWKREKQYAISAYKNRLYPDYHADTLEFYISSNTIWNISGNYDWIHCDTTHSSDNAVIRIFVDENKTSQTRKAEFLVTGYGAAAKTVYITQTAQPVSIENDTDNTLKLYPNPSTSTLSVELSSGVIEEVQLINLKGEIVSDSSFTTFSQKALINTQTLSNGVYFVKVKSSETAYHKKIVIMNH